MHDAREELIWLQLQADIADNISKNTTEHRGFTADFLIASGVTIQQWISVKDRLPEKDGIYLTFNKKKEYEFHFFQAGKQMWPATWDEDGVTHWMPMPQPPKGE